MPLFASLLGDWLLGRPGQGLGEQLVPEVGGMLLLIAAAVLIYRALRETYLLGWIAGIAAYSVQQVARVLLEHTPDSRGLAALASAGFAVAAASFVAAALLYTGRQRLLARLPMLAGLALAAGVAGQLWWPDAAVPRILLSVFWILLCMAGAVEQALFSRGRLSLGPWLMVAVLVLFPAENPVAPTFFANSDIVVEGLLGLSMLLTVVDDTGLRNRRLLAVNAITTAVAQAREFAPLMSTALRVMQELTDARAAWFRLLDGDQLVLASQLNVGEQYLRERGVVGLHTSQTGQALRSGHHLILRVAGVDPETRSRLRQDGLHHVLILPVLGKDGAVGALTLAHASYRSYRHGELEFLENMAQQLGMAVEGLRLLDRIRYSQRQWVNTFDSIRDMILVHDEHERIVRVNRALTARLGVEPNVVWGRTVGEILPPRDGQAPGCPYCARDGPTQVSFGERPDPCFGGYSTVSSYSYSEDGSRRLGTIHVVHDTTESRAAEQRYKMLFDGVQEGAFVSTPEGRLLECNDAFVRMLGYDSRDQVFALDIARDLYADGAQRQVFRREMDTRGSVRNYPVTLKRRDGTPLYALESSFATRGPDGAAQQYLGFLLDVSEQKRAEDELRRRNRELAVLNAVAVIATQSLDLDEILNVTVQHVGDLFTADSASIYLLAANSHLLRRRAAFGVHGSDTSISEIDLAPELLQRIRDERIEVISDEYLAQAPASVRQFVEKNGLRSILWVVLWSHDRPNGILGISSRIAGRYGQPDQQLLVSIGRQLATTVEKVRLYEETVSAYDNLRRTQEQLLQSEKMSAVGQLISGVAHELNNPLTAILGYAQLLETEKLGERGRDFAQKIFRQAQRTHRVVQNLLSFARQRKPQKVQVDLARVLDDTLLLRDYDLKLNNIVVERDYGASVPAVVADAHQFEQVFLNIINNAVDAMLEHNRGGTLRVRIAAEAGRIGIEFHDTGPGLKDAKSIFDPFYTTKEVGKGTGLGLSICYGIVKEHGGEITARNHPEGGAIFRITLPGTGAAATPQSPAPPRPEQACIKGRILIVDDEESVLGFEHEVLRGAGAEVITASRAEEALALLCEQGFDAYVIDGRMPGGWTGPDLYSWLRENRPGAEHRIVMTVSNLDDPSLRTLVEQRQVCFLMKPFQVAELIGAIRRVMERQGETARADR